MKKQLKQNHILTCQILRNKKGSALVFVIILFMIMTIFSVALLSVALSESLHVRIDQQLDQTDLVARSVVDSTYTWLSENIRSSKFTSVMPTVGSEKVSSGYMDGYKYELLIKRESGASAAAYLVTISAKVWDKNIENPSTAKLSFPFTEGASTLFRDAIYSDTSFGIKQETKTQIYDGNVNTGGDVDSADKMTFKTSSNDQVSTLYKCLNDKMYYPKYIECPKKLADFPPANVFNNFAGSLEIADNAYFNSLDLSGDTLTINNSDSSRDYYVYVKNDLTVDSQSTIHVKNNYGVLPRAGINGGRIWFFVDGKLVGKSVGGDKSVLSITMAGTETIGLPVTTEMPSPLLYLILNYTPNSTTNDPASINIHGNPGWYAFVYAPNYNILLNGGGSTTFNFAGAVISNTYGSTGNSNTAKYLSPWTTNSPFDQYVTSFLTRNIDKRTWKVD